jgi:DNA polymerase-4
VRKATIKIKRFKRYTSRVARTIMHLDLDAFFCAVEELRDPTLKDKPFVVGGKPNERGVVSSASYAARKFGVRNAMPTSQALRLCPALVVVSHSRGDYGEYSRRVMSLLREYGGTLEQISIDEAFVDVSGLAIDSKTLALEIQSRIRDEIHLPASIGIATSKVVAKMASGTAKPNGVLVIEPGQEAVFLAPMSVGELWGIGKQTVPRLNDIGIHTIGDLQTASPDRLRRLFHSRAEEVIARARGIDDSPVQTERETKSISEEITFTKDTRDADELRKTLLALSDQVASKLRANELHARTVHLKLRWKDFTTVTRQTTLSQPTQLGDDLFLAVEKLWLANWKRGEWVRLLGVGVSGLEAGAQMKLFDDAERKDRLAVANVVDALRKQYGSDVVKRASLTSERK